MSDDQPTLVNAEPTLPQQIHIAMSGLIGAGKTTLAAKIAEKLNLPLYREKVEDNPCLAEFYENPVANAFTLQISLLAQRLGDQNQIAWNSKGAVQDRSLYEDLAFCKMLLKGGYMTQRQYDVYLELFNKVVWQLPKPDIIIHLVTPPEQCMQRIVQRNRGIESGITLEYLQNLNNVYEEFLDEIHTKLFVVTLEWSEFKDVDQVIKAVTAEYTKTTRMHHITLQ
jgi:deoxyadenosine/deoxycytidine kinase